MNNVKPVYIKALVIAAAIFVIGVSMALSDLYQKVGNLEHEAIHGQGKCTLTH